MRLWHDRGRAGPTPAGVLHLLSTLACLYDIATANVSLKPKDDGHDGETYQEHTFSGGYIAGKTVTCDKITPSYYSAPMWTCKNIKVGGRRLRYWVGPGMPGNYHCGVKMDQWKARNDFGALCRHMMRIDGIKRTLWAAVISEASCDNSPGKRLLFVKTDEGAEYSEEQAIPQEHEEFESQHGQSQSHTINKRDTKLSKQDGALYGWEEFKQGRGYVVTFRCMMLPN